MKGGKEEERLYLFDADWLDIEKTDMDNMGELIARHKGRYSLGAFMVRPGMKVLDFPCGSGYGSTILSNHGEIDIEYHGYELDMTTVEFARYFYYGIFRVRDLKKPEIPKDFFDLICCVEGLEHIELEYHHQLIQAFYDALKVGGRLLVTMPEAQSKSGLSLINHYHVGELTASDFDHLLRSHFPSVQTFYHADTLHNGHESIMLFGICRKEGV